MPTGRTNDNAIAVHDTTARGRRAGARDCASRPPDRSIGSSVRRVRRPLGPWGRESQKRRGSHSESHTEGGTAVPNTQECGVSHPKCGSWRAKSARGAETVRRNFGGNGSAAADGTKTLLPRSTRYPGPNHRSATAIYVKSMCAGCSGVSGAASLCWYLRGRRHSVAFSLAGTVVLHWCSSGGSWVPSPPRDGEIRLSTRTDTR